MDGLALLGRNRARNTAWVLVVATLAGCGSASDTGPGMAEGIFAELGAPLPSATPEERAAFERGREAALRRFTPSEGLGPAFNVTFCAGCHEKPVTGGSASHYRDFLLVGDALTPSTVIPRGQNGVQQQFSLGLGRAPSDPLANVSATRNPIPFFGVGLLAEIPATEILRREDPDDADGDGISGRANYDGNLVGRFGRKAQTARIELFIRGPLFNHMGITSDPLSMERRAELPGSTDTPATPNEASTRVGDGIDAVVAAQAVIPDEPTVDLDDIPDPEMSESEVFDLVSFALLLAAPSPDVPTATTERGSRTFARIGCDECHVRSLQGPRGAIPAYTDLLLHDMGDALADGFPMGRATGREFRTQPLWGIGAVSPYLHDGRASTLDEAIRWHGGEAAVMREAYVALAPSERRDLLAFLESLGGASQRTDGLLPPDAPPPLAEEPGGPLEGLTPAELASFERGRRSFDRDFSYLAGVGPAFNGDACRSCHFDPVLGGAGPSGVDVIRQGIVSGTSFEEPSAGTTLPRHTTSAVRPEPDPAANFFEPRQTPSTLGLGLLERIPRATIEALADPDDRDGDGIAGRAHVLPDGRLGRFGWKASIPTLREFVRDALSSELGLTVPFDASSSFGLVDDADQAGDPEVDASVVDDLVAFLELLAPPPRGSIDPTAERAGAAVFEEVGCASCHVPSLKTADDVEVRAFTDLLLHDVARDDSPGIADGAAGMHDFRTPPLWGIAHTAPYFHDGRAATLEDAIAAHAGEAASARDRAAALDPDEWALLLVFLRSL